MGLIQDELQKIDGFLISISKNPDNDTYIFDVGFPKNWEFASNEFINVEKVNESDDGVWLKLTTESDSITFDEFVEYIKMVVEFNILIEGEKQKLEEELLKRKQEMEEMYKNKFIEIEQKKDELKGFNILNNKKSENKSSNNKSKSKTNGINEKTKCDTTNDTL